MPLNKQDIKSIREVFREEFPDLFEEAMTPFAAAIQKDINKVSENLIRLERRVIDIEDDTSYLRGRTKLIEDRIDELKEELKKKPNKEKIDEIEKQVIDLETRVSEIESQNSN